MANSPIPRKPRLAPVLARADHRIRRLEVNRSFPTAGTAIYYVSYSGVTPTSAWTPDFSTAVVAIPDGIGLIPSGSGVLVPPGWLVCAAVEFAIEASTPPPTGESVSWEIQAGDDAYAAGSDVMLNSVGGNQALGGTVPGANSQLGAGFPIILDTVTTAMGTDFAPVLMAISMWGIRLPNGGFPVGGGGA